MTLFAVGFAPGVQQTWREVAAAAFLGAVMGVIFIAADWVGGLRLLLPIVGTPVVAIVAFEVLHATDAPGGPVLLMIPGLFILIPGDLLCAATAEIAVGQFTPGAVRLAQAAVTLVQLAAGVIIAAELTGVGLTGLSQPAPPGHSLPGWLIVLARIPFTFGLALTFNARMRDVPWMLLLVYLAWESRNSSWRTPSSCRRRGRRERRPRCSSRPRSWRLPRECSSCSAISRRAA